MISRLVNSKAQWDQRYLAAGQEAEASRQESRFFAELALEHLPTWLVNDLRFQKRSLCVWGCGEGDGAAVLSQAFERSEVVGVDFAEAALERARARFPKLRFEAGDEQGLPARCDVLFSAGMLEHFEQPMDVLRTLLGQTARCAVVVVPFREGVRREGHCSTFDFNTFPLALGEFQAVAARVLDCSARQGSPWLGLQILVVYAHREAFDMQALDLHALAGGQEELLAAARRAHQVSKEQQRRIESELVARESRIELLEQDLEERVRQGAEKDAELLEIREEHQRLLSELSGVRASMSWRFANRYRAARGKVPLLSKAHQLVKRHLGPRLGGGESYGIVDSSIARQLDLAREFKAFLQRHRKKPLVVVYAAVKYVESEGQRSVRLAQSMVKAGHAALFVYWNWSDEDRNVRGEIAPGVFALARTDFLGAHTRLLDTIARLCESRMLLFELPDPDAALALVEGNCRDFHTVYDILDDWEEFNHLGQAPWFDEAAEHFFLRNSKHACAVTRALVQKFPEYDVQLIPNGFDPARLTDSPARPLARGDITIGYFGYLTDAWFDWDLIIDTGKRHPESRFHIVGYGMPEGLKLPSNVVYCGKVQPTELSGFAKNWDVCIIPFKEGSLAASADPIKLYEYLYFKKPVVVTGMPHLAEFPYVITSSNDRDAFWNALQQAKAQTIDPDTIKTFLNERTWSHRARTLVEAARATE